MSTRAHKIAEVTAGRARARGRAVDPKTQEIADTSAAERKAADLDDADTQWKILNPEVMEYTLRLPEGDRLLLIPMKFTWNDVHARRIGEEIAVFAQLFQLETQKARERVPNLTDAYGIALMRVREDARELVCKVARYANDDADAPIARPTLEDVAEGMALGDVTAIALRLVDARIEEVRRLKNAHRAAPSR